MKVCPGSWNAFVIIPRALHAAAACKVSASLSPRISTYRRFGPTYVKSTNGCGCQKESSLDMQRLERGIPTAIKTMRLEDVTSHHAICQLRRYLCALFDMISTGEKSKKKQPHPERRWRMVGRLCVLSCDDDAITDSYKSKH